MPSNSSAKCAARLSPAFCEGENGEHYVVKFRNNPQQVRVLANEMLASRLALLLGLPVPGPEFIDAPAAQWTGAGDPLTFDYGYPSIERFGGMTIRLLIVGCCI